MRFAVAMKVGSWHWLQAGRLDAPSESRTAAPPPGFPLSCTSAVVSCNANEITNQHNAPFGGLPLDTRTMRRMLHDVPQRARTSLTSPPQCAERGEEKSFLQPPRARVEAHHAALERQSEVHGQQRGQATGKQGGSLWSEMKRACKQRTYAWLTRKHELASPTDWLVPREERPHMGMKDTTGRP